MIMEIKVVKEYQQMEAGCDEALKQIEQKRYEEKLRKEGYAKIRKYGISFYRKECLVKMAE